MLPRLDLHRSKLPEKVRPSVAAAVGGGVCLVMFAGGRSCFWFFLVLFLGQNWGCLLKKQTIIYFDVQVCRCRIEFWSLNYSRSTKPFSWKTLNSHWCHCTQKLQGNTCKSPHKQKTISDKKQTSKQANLLWWTAYMESSKISPIKKHLLDAWETSRAVAGDIQDSCWGGGVLDVSLMVHQCFCFLLEGACFWVTRSLVTTCTMLLVFVGLIVIGWYWHGLKGIWLWGWYDRCSLACAGSGVFA